MDHYQTPLQVHVSAFAKGADKSKSKVVFEATQVSFFGLSLTERQFQLTNEAPSRPLSTRQQAGEQGRDALWANRSRYQYIQDPLDKGESAFSAGGSTSRAKLITIR